MRTDALQFLLGYDAWATERVLDATERLSADAFAAPAGPGHAAPRAALLHCVGGMRAWRERLQATPATAPPSEADFPTLAAVRALWRAEHALLREYLAGLAPRELDDVVEHRRPDRFLRAERWRFLLHLVLHHMQHRSELAQALTLLGHSPGEIGLTAFLHEHGERERLDTHSGRA